MLTVNACVRPYLEDKQLIEKEEFKQMKECEKKERTSAFRGSGFMQKKRWIPLCRLVPTPHHMNDNPFIHARRNIWYQFTSQTNARLSFFFILGNDRVTKVQFHFLTANFFFYFGLCFRLQKTLPAGRSFVAMDTKQIPQILQQIFTSTMLSSA